MNDNAPNRFNSRPPMVWNVAQTFSDPKSGTAVVVSKADGPRPMFSFVIGRLRDDGSVGFNMQFRTNRNMAAFELETDFASVIGALMAQAQAYATQEMQWHWAQNVNAQIDRESRRMDDRPGGGRIRHPGKTARDKAKNSRK